jgi:hypothetical protein
VIFTANTAGVPGTIAATETSTSGTASFAHTVTASGPTSFDNAVNWSAGATVADSDTVYLDQSAGPVLYGLDQSAVEPTAVYVPMSFTGTIGLPETNEGGNYYEYRSKYLQLGPAALEIGAGDGTGSGRIKIDSTSDVCALKVLNTGSSLDALPALIWKGTNASNSLVMSGGSVGIGVFGGEAATLATVGVSGGTLYTGSGVTLSGALTMSGGQWQINSLVDGSLTMTGGAAVINGTAGVDQLTIRDGYCLYNTSGTLGGNTVIEGGGVLDMGTMPTSVTVSNAITLRGPNCQFIDPNGRASSVSFTLAGGATSAQIVTKRNASIAVT